MDRQLFATGQIVGVAHGSLSGPRTADRYRIVRRYPAENQPAMYHIRSLTGGGQRMVPEDELSAVVPTAFDGAGRPGKVLQLFSEVVPFDRSVTT